jgi:uncharacterized protein YggE
MLTVVGIGSVKATPDIAYLRLDVETRAATAQAAQTQTNRAMREIIAGLRESGVDQADLAA